MNRQIRDNEAIKGLNIRGEEFKLQAYVDDLVIILENPVENLEELLRVIEEFGQAAGFKINYQKTKFIMKNIKKRCGKLARNSNFEAVKKTEYLEVVITKKPSILMKENYLAI